MLVLKLFNIYFERFANVTRIYKDNFRRVNILNKYCEITYYLSMALFINYEKDFSVKKILLKFFLIFIFFSYVSSITSNGGSFSTSHYNTISSIKHHNNLNAPLGAGSPIKLGGSTTVGNNILGSQTTAMSQFKVKMELNTMPTATGMPANIPLYNNYQAGPQLR